MIFAIALFILLPSFASSMIDKYLIRLNELAFALIEGGIRILIFIIYLFAVSRMKDIRRTFMYHGAEHRTINCFESGMELTVENVQKCSTRHNLLRNDVFVLCHGSIDTGIFAGNLAAFAFRLAFGYVGTHGRPIAASAACRPVFLTSF